MPPQLLRERDLTPAQVELSGVSDSTVRLSVGIEDVGGSHRGLAPGARPRERVMKPRVIPFARPVENTR